MWFVHMKVMFLKLINTPFKVETISVTANKMSQNSETIPNTQNKISLT